MNILQSSTDKLILSKASARITLGGGSTDAPAFIEKYGIGKVLTFSTNLFTYTYVYQDVNGFNNNTKKYLLSYSRLESCDSIQEIQNELIRTVLDYFKMPPVKVVFEADMFSEGSGLASSTGFILNLINSCAKFKHLILSTQDICKLGFKLEQKINPYNGYQDVYGSAYGGFKLLTFDKDGSCTVEYLSTDLFELYDFYLIYTNIKRQSKKILESVQVEKSYPLLANVDEMVTAIKTKNLQELFNLVKQAWELKKKTSPLIVNSPELALLDSELNRDSNVKAHKLCGAGGGGYYLAICNKGKIPAIPQTYPTVQVKLYHENLKSIVF